MSRAAGGRSGQVAVAGFLAGLKVGDLMGKAHEAIPAETGFGAVVRMFLQSWREYLKVLENGRFAGTISLHDIKSY